MKKIKQGFSGFALMSLLLTGAVRADNPNRIGTTAASFLEIGYSAYGNAMGDAAVAMPGDLTGLYWNPALLADLKQNEAVFLYQPWFASIGTVYTAAGIVAPNLGTFAVHYYHMDYGDMKVTSMQQQDGTGEFFSARDYTVGLSFGRNLVQWFSFGASVKYVASSIWHCKASAFAVDLGVKVQTSFFSPTGGQDQGMTLGMSIANYGTPMRFDGMDLMQPIDLLPYENGNYKYAEGKFKTQDWELPLIFRIGAAVHPIVSARHRLTLELDALHPNNNAESLNLGSQYEFTLPSGAFFLRGGYKALFLPDSEYGYSLGGGLISRLMNNMALRVEYAYRDIGVLGGTHTYSFSVLF